MPDTPYLSPTELTTLPGRLLRLGRHAREVLTPGERRTLHTLLSDAIARQGAMPRTPYGLNPLLHNLDTAIMVCDQVGPDRDIIVAVLLRDLVLQHIVTPEALEASWGPGAASLIDGLYKVSTLYSRQAAVMSDNFRNLLLTFAQDIRVIIITIVDRLALMLAINHHPDESYVAEVAAEAAYLYAPLAHRLGLYRIKGQLEDLSLKYTNRGIYSEIAHQLNETKRRRDAYIADFIAPVKQKLLDAGLKFDIKGRTKSISSIWNKLRKQNNDLEHIYDLFAIRIIIDCPPEKEKNQCWLAYSIVTDMYTPNPARMKDWISIPKSNGYESLHTTVQGPQGRWVEVQIRTRRMDIVAEKGLAAHWRYKGIKSEADLDAWMANVRDILDTAESGPMELMKCTRMDVYDHEVYVFTPRGDLHRLPQGASVLDFAFSIHSGLGSQCSGAIVNGRHRKINYKLCSGDTVEITTSPNQVPRPDWLNWVVTSKARNKIRQTLNESARRSAELARELLMRRFKNRKVDVDEGHLARLIKKLGYKTSTDFYTDISRERLDPGRIVSDYEAMLAAAAAPPRETASAEDFELRQEADTGGPDGQPLVIGNGVKGMNHRLARCCNPVYGDPVFGFVSSEGVVKVHRLDCPNAAHIRQRYPYRLIPVRWSGEASGQLPATLRILGHDDIGIVTNITSIISHEKGAWLRNISIDSHDGVFNGYLVVAVDSLAILQQLIKKIKTVKGVKNVQRSN